MFKGKKWLSHQAATEFIRNRTKVIVSAEKTFKEAQDETDKLEKTLDGVVNQLKGNRIIPTEIAGELHAHATTAIAAAREKIISAKKVYPKFLHDDPVARQLAELFDNAVGNDFEESEKEEILRLAEDRKQNKVPPGYLDNDKDGDRPYGDFYLWRQILDQTKEAQRPLILVTSERSEDWWERISGKTTGPRPELLKESRIHTGQRVLIYQTESFLELALKRFQQPVNEIAIEEIRAINSLRSELSTPAVKLDAQEIKINGTEYSSGILHVNLTRSVRNFTVSGHFEPKLTGTPDVSIKLLTHPDNTPTHRIRANTGTNYDFNVHVFCDKLGTLLPAGLYEIEYIATLDAPDVMPEILESESVQEVVGEGETD